MIKTMRKFSLLLSLLGLVSLGCASDENDNVPLTKDSSAPGQITNIEVVNLSGKAEIKYQLPEDPNLLYVKATYMLDSGREMEVKSSYYNKSLWIEGFAKAGERDIEITTVNRSEVESAPVTVTINPKESSLYEVFRSLEVGPDFGGVFIRAKNEERIDLALLLMEKNDEGDWETSGNSIYTSTDSIFRTIRGLDTINYDLAFTIRDRFLNTSDTLFKTIKPIYETEIPRTQYSGYPLPGDAPTTEFPFPISRMFDNDFRNWPRIYITDAAAPAPHSFTIDLGAEVKISRIKVWDYPQGTSSGFFYYWQFNMRKFEIWGSNNPTSDGSFNSWDKLGDYEVVKPSGLPLGQQNNEDIEFAQDGFNWSIPITAPKYRYLRINNLENWGGSGRIAIAELRVYGDTR